MCLKVVLGVSGVLQWIGVHSGPILVCLQQAGTKNGGGNSSIILAVLISGRFPIAVGHSQSLCALPKRFFPT